MNADEKDTNDRASAGDASGGQSSDMEEVIDLVDEISPDDAGSEPEETSDIDSKTEDEDEELIELTDIVEESSSGPQVGDIAVEGAAEEVLEPEGEQGPEEEEPIELTDAVIAEGDSGQAQEEVFELEDLVEEPGLDAGESGLAELSEGETSISEPDDDSLIDSLGLEISEEGAETPVEQWPEDENLATPEEGEQSLVSSGETQPEAEELAESGAEELGVEQGPEPVGGALEQAVLERLSNDKLEEIITNIVRQTIDTKVERILLEAAEAAIGREIERLKQAL